ncbi:MAG TPA: PIN domain-containing protein, partial [Spirochaetota bacterium]|nr:PIN domain-containing protein [Spirochaetota bacterium]
MGKNFILDTNVILHDSRCLYNFENNNVIIPIVVLEEIDNFKKGDDLKNFHARDFIRDMDRIFSKIPTNQKIVSTDGAPIREDLGKLILLPGMDYSEEVRRLFMENTPDHRILSLAYNLIYKENWKNVVIVSKDINLRMKARTLGIPADDYKSGTIKNIDELYTGRRILEDIEEGLFKEICDAPYGVDVEKFVLKENEMYPNEYFILKSASGSILARFDPFQRKITKLNKPIAYGIKPRNAEQNFALDALMDSSISIVTLSG